MVKPEPAGPDGAILSLRLAPGIIDEIREDREFIALLNLGRMVNAIQFALTVLRQTPAGGAPADTRQGVNAFLFCGSLLFEAIRHVNVLADKYPLFDRLGRFRKPYADGGLTAYEETVLKCARNKIVSHFDDEVFEDTLRHGDFNEVVFAGSHTTNLGDMTFTFADELVLGYLAHEFTGLWTPSRDDVVGMAATLIDLSRDFIRMAVELVTVVLTAKGWVDNGHGGMVSSPPSGESGRS